MVSILTRPEGRVQPVTHIGKKPAQGVSILTRPEGRVQLTVAITTTEAMRGARCFNPHPTRRPGATPPHHPRPHLEQPVSILTRPEGRVQHQPPG